MEEMSIHFDLEDVNNTLGTVEKNYQDFLEMSDSFLGWLLTLNSEEFDYVYNNMIHDFKKDPDGATGLLFTQIELIHQDNPIILRSELEEDTFKKIQMVKTIKSVKEGLLTYTPGETDMLWEFEVTEEGMKLVSLAETLVEVELKNRAKHGGGEEKENVDQPSGDTLRNDGAGE